MKDLQASDSAAQPALSRRELLKTGGKVAAGVAAAGALAHIPTISIVSASSTMTLNYLTGLTGGDGDAMLALVKQFNKEHPSIQVKMQSLLWANLYPKLNNALAAGNAPEVFTTHVQEMGYYLDKGLFLPLDDLFGRSLPESDFASVPMHYVKNGGHIYGMPLDMHGFAFYMNPVLLRKAGLSLKGPQTGDEVIYFARKMTVDKKGNNALSKKFDPSNVAAYGITASWTAPPVFLTTLWSFGGNTINPSGTQATLNTPQARQALNFWHDLIYKYHACNKPANYGVNGPFPSAWVNNAVAMEPDGNWLRSFFVSNPKVPRTVVFMPRFGANRVAWMSGHVIAAPAGLSGATKDAVYTFMRWLSAHGAQWSETAGHIPARTSQRTSSAVMRLWPQQVFGPELAEIGHIEQPNPNFFAIQDAYTAEVNAAWNGTTSVQAAMSAMQSRVQRALSGH